MAFHFLSHSLPYRNLIPLQVQRRGKYRCNEIANFFSGVSKREVIKQDDDMRSSRFYLSIEPAWDSILLRACICMLGAFRAAHHGRPYLEHCRLCIKHAWPFSSREHDMLLQIRLLRKGDDLSFFFLLPEARHVSRRGNTTGTKPQRSTALTRIWQVSFGAIVKANAKWISGLGHSWYLKSRRAFLVSFLWRGAFVWV